MSDKHLWASQGWRREVAALIVKIRESTHEDPRLAAILEKQAEELLVNHITFMDSIIGISYKS
jgi:hypothetical protein